ncbi:uncharacterized G-patch domain protein DDB_G0278987-like [Benincasa hispida]|uniref:uncharacterized G-patch domain protein DDB_G0278987-like n=1 Tax=Benincasa hispida TaxID=102211 RepID=UPI0018FF9EE5|nr:uncharacterized G-patch domain protein DDB_G0278987-like [Benincasa hispida]
MSSDQEKSSFHPKIPATNKKHIITRIIENDGVPRMAAWGGAFAFACSLVLASTFKRSKKIISPKRPSQDGDSDLDVGDDDKARRMEGLQLLLQSSSTDIINRSCHTTSNMSVKYTSIEDSKEENRPLMTEHILEKKKEENIVVVIYEEGEYPNSEEFIENEIQKYEESSKVTKSFPSAEFDDTWLEEWTYRPSTSSSSSSSSSSSEETSFSIGVFSQEIDGDDKSMDIVIYIDDDNENGEDEQFQRV